MEQTDFDDIKTVVISAVIVLNITLSVLVIAVIVRHPQLREDATTLFMLSLTLSDLYGDAHQRRLVLQRDTECTYNDALPSIDSTVMVGLAQPHLHAQSVLGDRV